MSCAHNILLRMFGRPAGLLGRLGGVIMARVNGRIAAQVIDLLAIRPRDKVLEIGFGPGVGVQALADRIGNGLVAGIDPSSEMVEQATARNRRAIEAHRVALQCCSVDALPFADRTFDKAIAINSMQVWPDRDRGLREILRVLKPNGCVVLGFTTYSGQARGGICESLTAAGFTAARIVAWDGTFCALAVRS